MLQKLTDEIAECYAHASHCRERAKQALDPTIKQNFFEMEGRWLSLAHNYEFAEQLSNYIAPFRKPKRHKKINITSSAELPKQEY
jgi:hypothetical protein